MKKLILTAISGFLALNAFCVQHIVVSLGDSFSPNAITINLGDTVVFSLGNQHNVREVSQSTWTANDTTQLPGFSLPNGGGMIVPSLGMHYYVCVPHASMGMKGTINVVENLGVDNHTSMVFSFYPNPAVDVVNVGFPSSQNASISYNLFNLTGQKIRSAKIQLTGQQNNVSIPVADLPRGIYMVTVSYGDIQRTRRIILQ